MTASVVAMRRAVNQYGSALGMRRRRRISMSPAAYERMSSRAAGSTWVRPRTVFTITGKKTIRAEIVIGGRTLSEPNQLIVIGANARIGIELAPIATGTR